MRLSEGRASCDYLVPEASDISAVNIHSDLNWHRVTVAETLEVEDEQRHGSVKMPSLGAARRSTF